MLSVAQRLRAGGVGCDVLHGDARGRAGLWRSRRRWRRAARWASGSRSAPSAAGCPARRGPRRGWRRRTGRPSAMASAGSGRSSDAGLSRELAIGTSGVAGDQVARRAQRERAPRGRRGQRPLRREDQLLDAAGRAVGALVVVGQWSACPTIPVATSTTSKVPSLTRSCTSAPRGHTVIRLVTAWRPTTGRWRRAPPRRRSPPSPSCRAPTTGSASGRCPGSRSQVVFHACAIRVDCRRRRSCCSAAVTASPTELVGDHVRRHHRRGGEQLAVVDDAAVLGERHPRLLLPGRAVDRGDVAVAGPARRVERRDSGPTARPRPAPCRRR